MRLITLNEMLIILDVTKANLILLYIERKPWKSCLCFFTNGEQQKARELDMITFRNQEPWS